MTRAEATRLNNDDSSKNNYLQIKRQLYIFREVMDSSALQSSKEAFDKVFDNVKYNEMLINMYQALKRQNKTGDEIWRSLVNASKRII